MYIFVPICFFVNFYQRARLNTMFRSVFFGCVQVLCYRPKLVYKYSSITSSYETTSIETKLSVDSIHILVY